MTSPALQLYEPPASPDASAGGVQLAPVQHVATTPGRWKWTLTWAACLVLLPVAWGMLQMLALLVQAERVRGSLEASLATALLPKSNARQVAQVTEAAIESLVGPGMSMWINVNGVLAYSGTPMWLGANITPAYPAGVSIPPPLSAINGPLLPRSEYIPFKRDDTIEACVYVSTDKLLPRWLGLRLPSVSTREICIRWQTVVP